MSGDLDANKLSEGAQGKTGEAHAEMSAVSSYYCKLTEILEFDRKHTLKRHRWAWSVVVVLGGLLLYCLIDTANFVCRYEKSLPTSHPIPEKFAITYISLSAAKIAAIVGALANKMHDRADFAPLSRPDVFNRTIRKSSVIC